MGKNEQGQQRRRRHQPPPAAVAARRLIAVVVGLVGTLLRHANVAGLLGREHGELRAELLQVQAGDLLVELLGQRVDADLVVLGPERELRKGLVGERVAHHEARVAGGAAEVDQATLGQENDLSAVGEGVQVDLKKKRRSNERTSELMCPHRCTRARALTHASQLLLLYLRLDVGDDDARVRVEASDIDLVVEVTNVADDGVLAHLGHVLSQDHVLVASGSDEDLSLLEGILDAADLSFNDERRREKTRRRELGEYSTLAWWWWWWWCSHTSIPCMQACRAQIGSHSVTITRAP